MKTILTGTNSVIKLEGTEPRRRAVYPGEAVQLECGGTVGIAYGQDLMGWLRVAVKGPDGWNHHSEPMPRDVKLRGFMPLQDIKDCLQAMGREWVSF